MAGIPLSAKDIKRKWEKKEDQKNTGSLILRPPSCPLSDKGKLCVAEEPKRESLKQEIAPRYV